MNNAVYGKTIEDLRHRIDVRLVNNEKDYLKCTAKPNYMSNKIFDNNLVVILKIKVALKRNKPVQTSILELSKILMYEFHYDYIENEYDNKSTLIHRHG